MKKSVKEILVNNKKFLISIALTVIICLISITCIQPIVFEKNFGLVYIAIQCVFAFIMFLLINFIMNFIIKLKAKDATYKKWLIRSIIYFTIMLILLLIIWPGHWVLDEFNILKSTVKYQVNTWQSYLTVIYMSICLMIIPSPVGIVIIQNIIISIIFGYVFTMTSEKFNNKIVNIILYAFMITPAIIINNLYPLRLTMYAYIMLLFFVILIFDKIEKNKLTLLKLFKLYILIVLLMVWRSEGMIFAILAPALIFITYSKNGINILKTLMLVVVNFIILFIYSFSNNPRYGLTIYINPLSVMLQEELKGDNLDKNLQDIDNVVDLKLLKENPSFKAIPAFWIDGFVREDFEKHMPEFKKTYMELVLNNFGTFFKYRMKTFLATSCMYEGASGNMESRMLFHYMDENYKDELVDEFLNKYKLENAINRDLKVAVENALIGKNTETGEYNTIFGLVFWNLVPILGIVVICCIWAVIKKNWNYVCIYVSLLGSTAIIFLTAPANHIMYYLPVYISGTVVSLIFIADRTKKTRLKN